VYVVIDSFFALFSLAFLASSVVPRGPVLNFQNRLNYEIRIVPFSGVFLGCECQIYCCEWDRCLAGRKLPHALFHNLVHCVGSV
jgi:hypothetical protein